MENQEIREFPLLYREIQVGEILIWRDLCHTHLAAVRFGACCKVDLIKQSRPVVNERKRRQHLYIY